MFWGRLHIVITCDLIVHQYIFSESHLISLLLLIVDSKQEHQQQNKKKKDQTDDWIWFDWVKLVAALSALIESIQPTYQEYSYDFKLIDFWNTDQRLLENIHKK